MWGSPKWKELGRVEVGRGQWCEAGMVGGVHVEAPGPVSVGYLQEEVIRELREGEVT